MVTIVDAGAALERCLAGLSAQAAAPEMEILVPWDDTVPGISALAAKHPGVRFLSLGKVPTQRDAKGPAGQHELFDRRRAAGLAAATGDLIAIVEDRGVPRPDWARILSALHERMPNAVIGGAIDHARDATLNWAVYFCDFGRYQSPFAAGPRDYVSDVNICYKRRAIDDTRELWRERYHETTVHWALQKQGEVLYLTPEFAVDQMRDGLTLSGCLSERIGWGRLFAYTRSRELSLVKRLVLAAASPLLPFVLFLRHLRGRLERHKDLGAFTRAAPATFLLLAAWSLGELLGYLTARP